MGETADNRFVVVSNRLPVRIESVGDVWQARPGAGGLVTALAPVLERNHGLWIGWPGCGPEAPLDELLASASRDYSFDLRAIPLSHDEEEGYYRGFANEAIWPLFHDLLGHCKFDLSAWNTYTAVNRRFAEVISGAIRSDDLVWIHDYQLLLVGGFMRELDIRQPLMFFLHTPFPSLDLFHRLPWHREVLEGLLAYDVLGFQTLRDRRNFVHCVRELVEGAEVTIGRRHTTLRVGDRIVKAGHFPISIDFDEFNDGAGSMEVGEAAWFLREHYKARQLILGIDRLDYTKGIPERFLAFERAIEKYPEMRGEVSLIQIVVPSRPQIPDYRDLKTILDAHAGRINARFSRHGWIPIHYHFRALDRTQLLAHYRACEIGLITPLRDGMNLVAKEYCASSIDANGVLILSQFAGAADQLQNGSIIVNPYDVEKSADAIYAAYAMDGDERARRMKALRSHIKRNDVHRWLGWVMSFSKNQTSGNPPIYTDKQHAQDLAEEREQVL